MHPTPLRVDKIVGILKVGVHSNAFPIYSGGAGDGQSVGWPANVVVGVSAWPFGRCALSPLPRPPHRAAPPTPYLTTPRRASPPVTPRGLQAGAGVTSIYRRWCGPPNPPLKLTPLCGPKVAAILKPDLDTNVIPVYDCGAA